MPRDASSPMLAALTGSQISIGFLLDIVFTTGQQFVWSGAGNLVYNGNTYLGVGAMGKVGPFSEGSGVSADGTTVSLSGIDPALLSACLEDIRLGAPSTVYFALFDQNLNILGTPYPIFVGTVDQPVLQIGPDALTIQLKLENRLTNLQRANMRRYTSADQNLYYPGDSAFNWVEILNDQALLWNT